MLTERFLRRFIGVCLFLFLSASAQFGQPSEVKLESEELQTGNCFPGWIKTESVIRDQAGLLKSIRNDRGRDACVAKLSGIDFAKNSLVGVSLNTGYCRRPLLLQHEVFSDAERKVYLINVTYAEPEELCRALSRFDLWLLVPRIPDGFEVRFDIKPIPRNKKQN